MASRAERGVTGRASKCLDLLGTTMDAVSNQGVDMSVCDAEVRALVVGTGEALCVYPLGCSPLALDLAPGAYRQRRWPYSRRESGGEAAGGQSSGVRGLRRRWILVCMALTLEWGGL
jgi:hypothetical protein